MSSVFESSGQVARRFGALVHAARPTAFRRPDLVDALVIWAVPTAVLTVWMSSCSSRLAGAGPYPSSLLAEEVIVLLVPMVVFPVWYVRRRDCWGPREFGLTFQIAKPGTWAGALGTGLLAAVMTESVMPQAPLLFLALSIWQPAIVEELFARGILQTKLTRALGLGCGLLASSALFAGMHLMGDLVGVSFLGGTTVSLGTIGSAFVFRGAVGLGLGAVYVRTRSLIPGMILHYLIDFGGAVCAWIV